MTRPEHLAELPDGWPYWPVPAAIYGRHGGLLPDDSPPAIDPAGNYVLYHGTSLSRALRIAAEGIAVDDIGMVGVGTTEGPVRTFAYLKAAQDGDVPVVVQFTLDKEHVRSGVLMRREGGHRDLWLVWDWSRPGRGIPRHAMADVEVRDMEGHDMLAAAPGMAR